MDSPRVGVIGVGNMGYHHVRVYSELEKEGLVKLVGIADIDGDRVKKVAEEFGTKAFTNYRELLREGVDAVNIVVPTRMHYDVSMFFLRNNVHVLVEKPISDTIERAEEMIREADRRGLILLVGHIERYNPAVQRLRGEVKNGVLGDIITMSAKRIGPFNPRVSETSVIIDLAVHDIDIMTYILESNPTKVYARSRRVHNESHAEDYAIIVLSFENKVDGVIETNRLTPYKARTLTIVGTKGVSQLDYIEQRLIIYGNSSAREVAIQKQEPLKLELKHFIECVTGKTEPLTPGVVGLNALKVAHAALKSSETGAPIQLTW